ncbi:MAG TPA: CorA family divalent cation transporter, partial [Sphingomonas sp.]|nr:CorA family divalent cation transporter [Sphingomonas sp.]
MLRAYPNGSSEALDRAWWIDLHDPTDEEKARMAERFRITVPDRAALSEIELSSRLRSHERVLYMSAPLVARGEDGEDMLSPVGFILSPDVLVTVRFADSGAFEAVHEEMGRGDAPKSPAEALIRLLEEIVDRAADRFERAAENVNEASRSVFSQEASKRKRRLGRETRRLRGLMVQAGRTSEQLVRVRHSILSVARIATFVPDRCEPRLDRELCDRLASINHDIDSLDQFEQTLSGRVQFVLDAATGFLTIEQNDVFKVLTVVSVAGVPPVLVVGIYGMNFHYMPELAW